MALTAISRSEIQNTSMTMLSELRSLVHAFVASRLHYCNRHSMPNPLCLLASLRCAKKLCSTSSYCHLRTR